MKQPRRIVQISTTPTWNGSHSIYALDDEGELWTASGGITAKWSKVMALPERDIPDPPVAVTADQPSEPKAEAVPSHEYDYTGLI